MASELNWLVVVGIGNTKQVGHFLHCLASFPINCFRDSEESGAGWKELFELCFDVMEGFRYRCTVRVRLGVYLKYCCHVYEIKHRSSVLCLN